MLKSKFAALLVSASFLPGLACHHPPAESEHEEEEPAETSQALKVGDPAPDFELVDQNREKVRLSSFKGEKNVVVAFYVLAFTGG